MSPRWHVEIGSVFCSGLEAETARDAALEAAKRWPDALSRETRVDVYALKDPQMFVVSAEFEVETE